MLRDRPPHRLTATVLGAGTMGAQIAAHLANAGVRTTLLDIVPKGVGGDAPPGARSALAAGAIKAMAKQKQRAPLMDPAFAARLQPGNLDDDLERAVGNSDLVVEAVIERLDIKRPLFDRLAKAAPAHCILATNTSGLPIEAIAAELPEAARKRVVGMHFFNPPRYLHLLEIVPSKFTDPAVVESLSWFGDVVLGKGIVPCRDTPNFIGNRVGIAEMILTNEATFEGAYTVEEVDLLNGPLMGRPRTGSFRLGDMIGNDVAALVVTNLHDNTNDKPGDPNFDELHAKMVVHPQVAKMLEKGLLGDKSKQGFYKKTRDDKGKRKILSLDLATLEYRDRIEPAFAELAEVAKIGDLPGRVAAAMRSEGRAGEFLRRVYLPLLNYSAHRVGSICDSAKEIDDAMRWGYGWAAGPFALWDAVGVAWGVEAMKTMGLTVAPVAQKLVDAHGDDARWYGGDAANPTVVTAKGDTKPVQPPQGVIVLAARKAAGAEIHSTKTAGLIDLGDGVACVEFRSKMGILDDGVVTMLREAIPTLERSGGFRALVIGSQADHFSAGADARRILALAKEANWNAVEGAVAEFQSTLMALRHAPMPVVGGPAGMTLGGGAECTLQCDGVVAGAELYMGLVEAGIGLVPAGGGLKEMVRRASAWAAQVPGGDPYPWLRRAFEACGQGKVSQSAFDARNLGFLRDTDGVAFNRVRVIAEAKRRAIGMCEAGYAPPDPDEPIHVVGRNAGSSFMLGAKLFEWGGYASEHDKLVAEKIAHVLSGGMTVAPTTVTAARLLELEREAFVSLVGTEKTQARIEHTLKTGKPLRN